MRFSVDESGEFAVSAFACNLTCGHACRVAQLSVGVVFKKKPGSANFARDGSRHKRSPLSELVAAIDIHSVPNKELDNVVSGLEHGQMQRVGNGVENFV